MKRTVDFGRGREREREWVGFSRAATGRGVEDGGGRKGESRVSL